MKRNITGCFFGIGLMLVLSGCGNFAEVNETQIEEASALEELSTTSKEQIPEESSSENETEYPYDYRDSSFFTHDGSIAYAPKARVTGVTAEGKYAALENIEKWGVLQGCCTDGTWVYAILENQYIATEKAGEFKSEGIIFKIDPATWEIKSQSESLPLDHGNDITYNSKTGFLMVVNCYDNPYRITRVDPETLTVVDTIDIQYKIYGLAYHEEKDMYVAGIRGTYDFVILDAEFHMVQSCTGVDTGFIKQNIDCDDQYIYFVQYQQNSIICYRWDGTYAGAYYVAGCYAEAESMFHVGDDFYMAYNTGGTKGGMIYALTFDRNALD